ncbi:MAG TPA: pseudouridine synthase [Thermoanaerobaculia bacterium]|nr:pseudouridine synthase [Thermoanaerobaculia bacterium]
MSEERLQKILARAGIASRRKAEELIREGRVTVNGQPAAIGDKADLERDSVRLDEQRIQVPAMHRYLLLNKPRGVMSTVSDPAGRPTVIDLVPPVMRRALAPVGRLDFQTEGLLLLTDDGELAQHVAHPSFGCWKTYEVKVRGRPEQEQIERLRAGIVLEGRRTAPCRIAALRRSSKTTASAERRARRAAVAGGLPGARGAGGPGRPGGAGGNRGRAVAGDGDNASWWSVQLGEGRTRQIREMFQRIGHPVQKLRRVAIGPVSDPDLPLGALRELSEREVAALRKAGPPGPSRPAAAATAGEGKGEKAGGGRRAKASPRSRQPGQPASRGTRKPAGARNTGAGKAAAPRPRRAAGARAGSAGQRRPPTARPKSPSPRRAAGGRAGLPNPRSAAGGRAGSPGPRRPAADPAASAGGPRRPAAGRAGAGGPRRPAAGRAAPGGPRRPAAGRAAPGGPRRSAGGRAAPGGPRRPTGGRRPSPGGRHGGSGGSAGGSGHRRGRR